MADEKVHVERVVDIVLDENAYVIYVDRGGPCWIVDPSFPPQPQRIARVVRQHSLEPEAILLTHCHGDHIAGIDDVLACWPDLQVLVPQAEAEALGDPVKNLSAAFGIDVTVTASATHLLVPGEVLTLQGTQWQVLDTSGHSPGGVSFYCAEARVVLTGDALFAGSVGRTDLPGSSAERLLENLRRSLLSLPADVIVYPGHGPSTTIGQERVANPFLRPRD